MLREFQREYFIITSKIISQPSSPIYLIFKIYFVMINGNKINNIFDEMNSALTTDFKRNSLTIFSLNLKLISFLSTLFSILMSFF